MSLFHVTHGGKTHSKTLILLRTRGAQLKIKCVRFFSQFPLSMRAFSKNCYTLCMEKTSNPGSVLVAMAVHQHSTEYNHQKRAT